MNRKTLGALLVALVFVVMPGRVSATFHLVKVVEVFPGATAEPTAQYVMLQMYFPGQTLVSGHQVGVFDATGTSLGTFTFSRNLSNGANLATIWIATPTAEDLFGINADLMMTAVIPASGGAVCYDVIDCVTWGNFSATGLPSLPEPPFNPTGGLVLDMAMHRTLSSGGSVTPFVFAPPAPKNNAGDTVLPTATPTPVVSSACVGDCNGDLQVTVDEILSMVNIALGNTSVSACEAGDANHDGEVTVNEILAAVNNALNSCPVWDYSISVAPDDSGEYRLVREEPIECSMTSRRQLGAV